MINLAQNEVKRICQTLLCQESAVSFSQDEVGAVSLYDRSFFPWKGLPYPLEHAKLALLLHQLGYTEVAKKMAVWQRATLDHAKHPIYSFFLQEKGCSYDALKQANLDFFNVMGEQPAFENPFVHNHLGIVNFQKPGTTILCAATGCKSGMGVFYNEDAGIINYGPSLTEMWDCTGFGLAGRAHKFLYEKTTEGFDLSYHVRLAAPHPRETGFATLQDSGFSGLWMNCKQSLLGNALDTSCSFEGIGALSALTFSLFGKGRVCIVAKSHRLAPRSLDRYEGPCQIIEFEGDLGKVSVEPKDGIDQMQVIPLAGDESFWGADFLISFKMKSFPIQFSFNLSN